MLTTKDTTYFIELSHLFHFCSYREVYKTLYSHKTTFFVVINVFVYLSPRVTPRQPQDVSRLFAQRYSFVNVYIVSSYNLSYNLLLSWEDLTL